MSHGDHTSPMTPLPQQSEAPGDEAVINPLATTWLLWDLIWPPRDPPFCYPSISATSLRYLHSEDSIYTKSIITEVSRDIAL